MNAHYGKSDGSSFLTFVSLHSSANCAVSFLVQTQNKHAEYYSDWHSSHQVKINFGGPGKFCGLHSPSLPLQDINSSKFGVGHQDSMFPLEKSGEEARMPSLLSEYGHRDFTFQETRREQRGGRQKIL